MGQYKKSTLTAAGERLVAQAIGGEIKLNITKVKTSNHQYPDGTNFKSLVDMDGIVQTMVGPKTAVYNDTLIQTRALFSNEEVKETYYIHNIGLYAMDGSEEVLFSISSATTPDEMPKYDGVAPTTCIYNIQNTISETSSVSLTINPAGYASIADIMELDEKKVDKTGDISETTINTLDEPATDVQFPVPVAGESTKTFLGKVKKFFEDTKNWMTGVCLIGQIVNNCVTNNDKLPLSAAQGKVLMDLYTVLNTKILELKSYTNEIKYRSYQTVIPIQESWIDGNICNIPFDITTALMTDKPYIFYVLPCSVIGHQVRYDYDLSTSTVAIVSIEFGAQLIAGNNVRFGIFIAGI